MKKSSSLMKKTKKVAGEISAAAKGAVKAVVQKLKTNKRNTGGRSGVVKHPKVSKSKATAKRRTKSARPVGRRASH